MSSSCITTPKGNYLGNNLKSFKLLIKSIKRTIHPLILAMLVLMAELNILNKAEYANSMNTASQIDIMSEFNYHMDKIDPLLNTPKTKKVCKHIYDSLNIIEINLKELKRIEPYYNWQEIKEALLITQERNC